MSGMDDERSRTVPALTEEQLASIVERATRTALTARSRIEDAVDKGELPAWVLEVCQSWESAALVYGAGMAERGAATRMIQESGYMTRH